MLLRLVGVLPPLLYPSCTPPVPGVGVRLRRVGWQSFVLSLRRHLSGQGYQGDEWWTALFLNGGFGSVEEPSEEARRLIPDLFHRGGLVWAGSESAEARQVFSRWVTGGTGRHRRPGREPVARPTPPSSAWVRDLTGDGDVESNPGPPPERASSSAVQVGLARGSMKCPLCEWRTPAETLPKLMAHVNNHHGPNGEVPMPAGYGPHGR